MFQKLAHCKDVYQGRFPPNFWSWFMSRCLWVKNHVWQFPHVWQGCIPSPFLGERFPDSCCWNPRLATSPSLIAFSQLSSVQSWVWHGLILSKFIQYRMAIRKKGIVGYWFIKGLSQLSSMIIIILSYPIYISGYYYIIQETSYHLIIFEPVHMKHHVD